MCRNKTEPLAEGNIHAHRTARFESRQRDARDTPDGQIFRHQNSIAVPPEAHVVPRQGQDAEIRFRLDQTVRQGGRAGAQPQIGFLQRDHIRIEAIDNLQNAFGVATLVDPARLPDVVACQSKGLPGHPHDIGLKHGT